MTKDKNIHRQPSHDAEPAIDHRYPPVKFDTLMARDPSVSTEPKSIAIQAPISKTLGRYRILSELGRGGMGAVYLAEDDVLKRKVALKIPQFEPSTAEQMKSRFLREAQMAAQLSHPNICQIYDVGVVDGQLLMAMEYIAGRTLSVLTTPDKLANERQVVGLIRKIALAMEVAHKLGMVHRDLKPGNIMLAKPDPASKIVEPKIMDFGLAKSLDPGQGQLTNTGMLVGTPCYMSKEQWSGKEGLLGPAADVFSLGVILYELLTGYLPYDHEAGEPPTAWFVKLVTQPQTPPNEHKPDLDLALAAIVIKSIAKESQDRYASMAEFAAALDEWQKAEPKSRLMPVPQLPPLATPVAPNPSLMVMPVTQPLPLPIQPASSPPSAEVAASTVPAIRASSARRRSHKNSAPWMIGLGFGGAAILVFGIIVVIVIDNGSKGQVTIKKKEETFKTKNGEVEIIEGPTLPPPNPPSANEGKSKEPSTTPAPPSSPTTQVAGKANEPQKSVNGPIPNSAIAPFDAATAKHYQEVWAAYLKVSIEKTNDIGVKMILIPPGEFKMGLREFDKIGSTAERPLHNVRISEAFYMCELEVTQRNFQTVTGRSPWNGKKYVQEGGGNAASYINWEDAVEFCHTLSAREKKTYRLPTEAEWEYACRGGTTTIFSFGESDSKFGEYGWCGGLLGTGNAKNEKYPHFGGLRKPNSFGLCDMHGNLYEWCQDVFDPYAYGRRGTLSIDPNEKNGSADRVLRGGSWSNSTVGCTTAGRFKGPPNYRGYSLGFRVVCELH